MKITILTLMGILILLMYKDCKKEKDLNVINSNNR